MKDCETHGIDDRGISGSAPGELTSRPTDDGRMDSPDHPTLPGEAPRGPRRLPRKTLRGLAYASCALVALFFLLSGVIACRYHVSLPSAGRAVVETACRVAVQAGVSIYDPCASRSAGLAPDDHGLRAWGDYERIEDFLARGQSKSGVDARGVKVTKVHNERIVRSIHSFRYQPFDEPRLHELRAKYGLEDVVAGASDEFEAQVLLRSWARSQFRRKDYQPMTANFDALAILDRDLRNDANEPYQPRKHYDPCHSFPLLYSQVLLSMGHQARMMSIGHGMVEIWSNQHGKWIAMDAELDLHYEKNGVPLSMLEIHNENFVEKPSKATIVRGTQSSGDSNTTMVHLGAEELSVDGMVYYHKHFAIVDMRNDWLTNHYFRGHPARGNQSVLIYDDPRLPRRRHLQDWLHLRTSREDDLYWTLNQTEILVWDKHPGANALHLAFDTVTPNFDFFEVVIDGTRRIRSSSSALEWKLHEGSNTLSVCAVNKFGVRGITSSVELQVD